MLGRWLFRHRILVVSLILSLALHFGAILGLDALPEHRSSVSQVVEMKMVMPPERSIEPVPLPEEPPKPKPKPKPKPRPRKKPLKVLEKRPTTKLPPPNTLADLEPPPMNRHPAEPIAGLTSDSFVADAGASGPVFGAGNTLLARPPEKPVRPEQVEPYSQPVDLADVTTEPRVIERPSPEDVFGGHEYPPEAKARGVEGAVRVKLLVDETGRVREARALKGPPSLRGPAEQLALRLRYKPATIGRKPVAVWWYEEIGFRITD